MNTCNIHSFIHFQRNIHLSCAYAQAYAISNVVGYAKRAEQRNPFLAA